jgi:hypothetical protein
VTRRRLIALTLVWTLPSAVFLAVAAMVYTTFRIAPPDRLDEEARRAVMATLRAALAQEPPAPCPVRSPIAGMVAVTVWIDGRTIARVEGQGEQVGAAIDDAAAMLRDVPALRGLEPSHRGRARIQVDVLSQVAPLGGIEPFGVPHLAELLANLVQHARIGSTSFAIEQTVESQRRVEFRRHWRHRRAPRNVRGVHHRVTRFVESANRAFAGQYQTR